MFDLSGKVAFIPGGYGGIGSALCVGLAQHGAAIVAGGRDVERARAIVERLGAEGHRALAVGFDARAPTQVRDAVGQIVERFGHVDILVNCVGIQIEEPLLEVTEDGFDAVYATNLKAAMFLGQAVAQHQVRVGRGGRQVHVLSVRSKLALRGRGYSAYTATKAGLAALVQQHAMELAPHGITVNGVAPTFVETELVRSYLEDATFRAQLESRIPLGRVGQPADIVGPVVFLASAASDFVTGQVLYVDGGVTASQ
jgi:NAD(P)-dependent dehydrogenase (short-subunit alcohol dehydrogenase family)